MVVLSFIFMKDARIQQSWVRRVFWHWANMVGILTGDWESVGRIGDTRQEYCITRRMDLKLGDTGAKEIEALWERWVKMTEDDLKKHNLKKGRAKALMVAGFIR